MVFDLHDVKLKEVGSWQQYFTPSCSERIQKAKKRAIMAMEICVEAARAEMKAIERYKNEPLDIQAARIFETFLRDKTIRILDGELIVGNIASKTRGATFIGEMTRFVDEELNDPVKDFQVRPFDKIIITPEERKELREVLLPYFKGKTVTQYILDTADAETREKAFIITSPCKHIPVISELSLDKAIPHLVANYEKILHKGLNGIREEVVWYMSQLDQPYTHYRVKERKNFYEAILITLDAAIAYSNRYANLAREMANKEINPKRKHELERIAEICEWVPANPARDWWEALQSLWMTECLIVCHLANGGHSPGRLDQYMYPYYKKSVLDDKTITRDEALELLESFWIKFNEWAFLLSYDVATFQPGQGLSFTVTIGGQTQEGKDACNEVTMLCLDAEEQIGLPQPEFAMRIWEGTPDKYLKKAAECIRLGRGKPKFMSDRKAIQMAAKAYPNLSIEDWREYLVSGCTEHNLPYAEMLHAWEGLCIVPKILELVLENGKCSICGRQIGPHTGNVATFESMSAWRKAFQEQLFYWMTQMAKGIKIVKEGQARKMKSPFGSAIMDGTLQKGIDMIEGGAWNTSYSVFLAGLADTADSLTVIDKLVYRDKKVTVEQLIKALKADWKGYEDLQQLCINGVPKYGNDNDFADTWAVWVMDTWYDAVDWINSQKNLLPYYGGQYVGAGIIGQSNVTFAPWVGAMPNGRTYQKPFADALSPYPGYDKNGISAVIKSVSKLPTNRFASGGLINLRLSPQLMATEKDLDNFVALLRTLEELGIYHTQFNVVSSEMLRKAMKEPDKYQDLLVRVASYCTFFVELTKDQQLDIIARTEHGHWA